MKKKLLLLAAALVAAATIVVAVLWYTAPEWPVFPAAKGSEPQVVVKVDRDYAHHLGDLIEVELFVRQQPGTTVEPKSLSVGGDFELSKAPGVTKKELEDGSVTYRFKLAVQSFRVKKEQVLEGSIGYRVDEKRLDQKIPPLSLHTSNTWDGREALMEGDNPRVPAWWITMRHAVPLALSSIVFLFLTAVALVRWVKTLRKDPVVDQAKVRVEELLALVKAGKCSKAQHLELDGLVRKHFEIGPIPAAKLEGFNAGVITFLRANEPAVYAEDALSADKRTELSALGETILGDNW